MYTIVEKIQTNKTLSAFKDAANKIAFLNIGIAIVILVTHQFKQMDLKLAYQLAMLITGYIMSDHITKTLLETKRASLQMSAMFASLFVILPFIKHLDYLPIYPIFSGILGSVLGNIFQHFNENFLKGEKETPTAVIAYFNQLLPILAIFMVSALFIFGLHILFDSIIHLYLSLIAMMSHVIVLMVVIVLICSFWYLGIHGVSVVSTIMRPFWLQMVLFNAYYFVMNEPIPYIGTEIFLQWFVWLGGSGGTLGLSFSLKYLSKSKTFKDLGDVSFRSVIHNINETVIFGVPISENKAFRIPFFLTPLVLTGIGYAAIHMGFIPNFSLVMPWVLPIPLGALLSSGLSLKVMLMSLFLIFISWLIYYPFFRSYDQAMLEEENS